MSAPRTPRTPLRRALRPLDSPDARATLERLHRGLRRGQYRISSPPTRAYNCLSWVHGDNQRVWSFERLPGAYWPRGVPRDDEGRLDTFLALFEHYGFRVCESAAEEPDVEKVAIYVQHYHPPRQRQPVALVQHVARQCPGGWWASKLGNLHDIEHERLDQLEDEGFGQAEVILCRPHNSRSRWRPPASFRRLPTAGPCGSRGAQR